jgi:hypothetical protein
MPSWDEYVDRVEQLADPEKFRQFVRDEINRLLTEISNLRGGRNVIFYSSAWLQKPTFPPAALSLSPEEINGFMAVMKGMNWERGLTLLLHTPGGSPNAAETVGEYLLSKFGKIETIVPTYAQSAGTMLAMISDRLVMGRQSQLGPIDPQLMIGTMPVSALSVEGQFERAKKEIIADQKVAHAWAPILQSLGPGLLVESSRALEYGKRVVAKWLTQRAFKNDEHCQSKASKVADSLAAAPTNVNHGQRIDISEAKALGLDVEPLEGDQALQEAVLSLYHMVTILFEKSDVTKALFSSTGSWWLKQHQVIFPRPPAAAPPSK